MGIFDILRRNKTETKKKAYDLVCGMSVDPEQSKLKSKFKDKTHYFCSEHCKKQFDEDPKNYI